MSYVGPFKNLRLWTTHSTHLELDELTRTTHETRSATLDSEHMFLPRELRKLGRSTASSVTYVAYEHI
jgi:hypothetical protein